MKFPAASALILPESDILFWKALIELSGKGCQIQAPVPPLAWGPGKTLDTLELPPACPQPNEGIAYIDYYVPRFNKTSEDCLYLNVYVPKHGRKTLKAVLVFVHGGSYQTGMGAMFDGSVIASNGVVVVNFNYRLGPLGFLSASDRSLPGNYGMLDQVAALKWVKENIKYFQGDPTRITIDGHSAGGCSVGLLLLSPLTKGLFSRVIQQSGSVLAHWAVGRQRSGVDFNFRIVAGALRCMSNSTYKIKECLQGIPPQDMDRFVSHELENYLASPLAPSFRPVTDNYFLPDTPERLAMHTNLAIKEFMAGATKDEGLVAALPLVRLFGNGKNGMKNLLTLMNHFKGELPEIKGILDRVLDEYVTWPYDVDKDRLKQIVSEVVGDYFIIAPTHLMAQILSRRNVSVYVYNYEYRSSFSRWEGVVHGADLMYLAGFPFSGHPHVQYNSNDKKMAKLLIQLWINFIKYGKPTLQPHNTFTIGQYLPSRPVYAKIYSNNNSVAYRMENDLKPNKLAFWNEKVPEYFKVQARKHTYTIADTRPATQGYIVLYGSKTWILISVCIGLSILTVMLAVFYCRTKKEVKRLIRQPSVSSGERMI